MCDKIVDCLEGEDEINCNYMRSPLIVDDNLLLSEDDVPNKQLKTIKVRPAMNNEHIWKHELKNTADQASHNTKNSVSENRAVDNEHFRNKNNNDNVLITNKSDISESTKYTVNTGTESTTATDLTSSYESTIMSNSSTLQENFTIIDDDKQFIEVNESITPEPTEFVTDSESEILVDDNSKQLRDMEVPKELLPTTHSGNIHITTETTTLAELENTVNNNTAENHSNDQNVQDIINIKHIESSTNANTPNENLKLVDDKSEKQGKRLDIELDSDVGKEIPVIDNIKQLIENLNNEKHNLPIYLESAKVKKQHHSAEHFECNRYGL